jgi:hypothetical protein
MSMRPQFTTESRSATQVAGARGESIGGIGSNGRHTRRHQRWERNEAAAARDGIDHAAYQTREKQTQLFDHGVS